MARTLLKLWRMSLIVGFPTGFQLRIVLREVLPAVWRRFLVPGSITLPGLHLVIQEVMGWENCHLHRFRFGNMEDGMPDSEYPTEGLIERGRRFREFVRWEGEVFGYEYDFEDNREHDVIIERIMTGAEVAEPTCLEGERALLRPRAVRPCKDQPPVVPVVPESMAGISAGSSDRGTMKRI